MENQDKTKNLQVVKDILRKNEYILNYIRISEEMKMSEDIDIENWIKENIITNRDNCIAISNESDLVIHNYNCETQLVNSLLGDFTKEGFEMEYSYGAFELYKWDKEK